MDTGETQERARRGGVEKDDHRKESRVEVSRPASKKLCPEEYIVLLSRV